MFWGGNSQTKGTKDLALERGSSTVSGKARQSVLFWSKDLYQSYHHPICQSVTYSFTQPLICSCHPSPTDTHSCTLSLAHILYYRVFFNSISTGLIMHNTTCECLCLTRYLFFADLGNSGPGNDPRIERTYMDGSNRFDLKLSKILNPRGLTVDPVNQRLFWVDSHLDHLETVDYYGLNRYF